MYPHSGLDGKPLSMLSTRYSTFVFCDWNASPDAVRDDVHRLKGFDVVSINDIDVRELIPADWRSVHEAIRRKPTYSGPFGDMPEDPFTIKWCLHVRWQRRPEYGAGHGRDSLDLLYFGGEATLVFEALYTRLRVNPAALCILQPGGGFGSAVWTHIEQQGSFFHQLVKSTSPRMPEVLLYGGNGERSANEPACWPEYESAGSPPKFFGEYHVRNDPIIGNADGFEASVLEYRLRRTIN